MEAGVYDEMGAVEDSHWWFVSRRRIVQALLARLDVPAGAEVLEIGAGTGGNLAMLSEIGRLTAVEMSEHARSIATVKTSVKILSGQLPDGLPLFDNAFDLVVLLDVLEHVDQDAESLCEIFGLLNPGGYVLLTVPAFQSLWSQHDEVHHHCRRYRRAPFQALLRRAGFEVVYLSYFNTWLFPPIAAVRLLQSAHRPAEHTTVGQTPPPLINALLEAVFSSERHLIGRMTLPFGVSLLAVARRVD